MFTSTPFSTREDTVSKSFTKIDIRNSFSFKVRFEKTSAHAKENEHFKRKSKNKMILVLIR